MSAICGVSNPTSILRKAEDKPEPKKAPAKKTPAKKPTEKK